MESASRKGNQITEGVIWKQLLLFFFPIVLGTFFQQLYNTADSIVVGRFVGTEALASVGGSTAMIANLVVGFFVGLSSGATVIISQFYGAKDKKQLSRALHTAYAFSLVGGLVITFIGIFLAPWLLKIMNTPLELIHDSTLYLRIYFGGILFVFIYNVGSSILRAVGDSRQPLYFLIVCCILNILLDILLVIVFHMGVAGAALATILSQIVSAILVTIALLRSDNLYQLKIHEIRFYKSSLLMLLWIGLPSGLQSVMYNASNMMIQTALNAFGSDTIAAWAAFGKIDAIYWMIINAFGIAVTTFVGQNYGAGLYARMRKSVRIGLVMSLSAAFFITIFLYLTGRYLFSLFTVDQNVITIGMDMLHLIAPTYFLFVFIELLSGALRGTGDVVIPTLMTSGGICLLRVIWLFFVVPRYPALRTIIYSYPITWVITAVLFIIYYTWKARKYWTVPSQEAV